MKWMRRLECCWALQAATENMERFMKNINDTGIEGFYEDGGWKFLSMQGADDEVGAGEEDFEEGMQRKAQLRDAADGAAADEPRGRHRRRFQGAPEPHLFLMQPAKSPTLLLAVAPRHWPACHRQSR